MATAGQECRQAGAPAKVTNEAGNQDDDRKRHVVEEQRNEGRSRQPPHRVVLERAPADPQHGLDHDHQHGGLQPEEQALHDRHLAEQDVDPAQGHDGEQAGQHEQRSGEQAALGLVHQPADIDGELLRFGTGQQVAVVEGLQEALFADPPFFLDDDAMHHRDLAGRPAEGEGRDAGPDFHRFAEGNAMRWRGWSGVRCGYFGHVSPAAFAFCGPAMDAICGA
jgi:hypothetical protein